MSRMSEYPTLIHERVALAQNGLNPWLICRMPSGWAVMGDWQFIPGYVLLLADPVVERFTDLDEKQRGRFGQDMALIGEALLAETDAVRINYEILGNTDHALHAHMFPRYESEPEDKRVGPVWHYDPDEVRSVPYDPAEHGGLQERLAAYITKRLA